jgi:hypothetical protein
MTGQGKLSGLTKLGLALIVSMVAIAWTVHFRTHRINDSLERLRYLPSNSGDLAVVSFLKAPKGRQLALVSTANSNNEKVVGAILKSHGLRPATSAELETLLRIMPEQFPPEPIVAAYHPRGKDDREFRYAVATVDHAPSTRWTVGVFASYVMPPRDRPPLFLVANGP